MLFDGFSCYVLIFIIERGGLYLIGLLLGCFILVVSIKYFVNCIR